jgi:hypothetical protein
MWADWFGNLVDRSNCQENNKRSETGGGEGREPKTGDEDSNYTRGITMSARFNHIISNFLPTELAGISPLAVNHASPLNATS